MVDQNLASYRPPFKSKYPADVHVRCFKGLVLYRISTEVPPEVHRYPGYFAVLLSRDSKEPLQADDFIYKYPTTEKTPLIIRVDPITPGVYRKFYNFDSSSLID